jgi:hypothetical protein
MKTGIIIQETTAGLNTIFHTESLSSDIHTLDTIIDDERMLDAQLSNRENYFAVEYKKGYKFYRLVSPTISDFTGRSGYYSVIIVVQLKDAQQIVNINEPCELLKNIEFLYRELRVLDNPDYKQFDELANSIKVIPNDYQYIDTPAKNILFQKIDIQSNISIQLNNNAAIGVQKICFFSRNAVDDSHFQQNKYEQLASDSSNYLRQISVENKFNETFVLEVNDKSFTLTNVSGFYVNPQSTLSYKLKGESKQAVFGNRIKIERKIASKPISSAGTGAKHPNNNWMFVTIGVFVVGILSFFAYTSSGNEEEPKVNTANSGAINASGAADNTATNEYFEIVGDSILRLKNDFISNTNRVKLPQSFIMFKGEENKIYFRNGFSQNKDVEYDSLKFEDFNLTVFDNSEEAKKVHKIQFHKELQAKLANLKPLKVIESVVIKAEPPKKEKPKAKEAGQKVKVIDTPKDDRD